MLTKQLAPINLRKSLTAATTVVSVSRPQSTMARAAIIVKAPMLVGSQTATSVGIIIMDRVSELAIGVTRWVIWQRTVEIHTQSSSNSKTSNRISSKGNSPIRTKALRRGVTNVGMRVILNGIALS